MWQGLWRTVNRQRLPNIVWCPRRCVSTSYLDPSLRSFASSLVREQPVFELPPSSIQILSEPSQFYKTLLDMIRRAERRIFISSLYIGSSESELISTLGNRLRENPDLNLYLLLDLNRCTRPGPSSPVKILIPLLREFPSRVHISMFRSPSLRGILAKLVPPRFKEGWGTWHAKIYGVDDDVMISGANLSKSYFTNRQDRYLYFSAEKKLAQYCFDFVNMVTKFSYQLLPNFAHFPKMSSPHSYSHEDYTLNWPDSDTHPHYINQKAEAAFSQLQKFYRQPLPRGNYTIPPAGNILVIPIIQAGQFNIREEESVFQLLFRQLGKLTTQRPMMDLTSGYFSLYKPYQNLILQVPNLDCRIVAASPKANGFYGSRGISGRIPEGYTLYEHRFMRAVVKAGRLWKGSSEKDGTGVLLSEWEKPGWTYHAKGVWLSPCSSSPPVLTLFGSTNLNSRSAHIDNELSFLMIIPSESAVPESIHGEDAASLTLRQKLDSEINRIRSNAVEWRGGSRNVRWTTKFFVWLVKGML